MYEINQKCLLLHDKTCKFCRELSLHFLKISSFNILIISVSISFFLEIALPTADGTVKSVITDKNNRTVTTEKTYTEAGTLATKTKTDADGKTVSAAYTHDGHGRMTSKTVTNAKGGVSKKEVTYEKKTGKYDTVTKTNAAGQVTKTEYGYYDSSSIDLYDQKDNNLISGTEYYNTPVIEFDGKYAGDIGFMSHYVNYDYSTGVKLAITYNMDNQIIDGEEVAKKLGLIQ